MKVRHIKRRQIGEARYRFTSWVVKHCYPGGLKFIMSRKVHRVPFLKNVRRRRYWL